MSQRAQQASDTRRRLIDAAARLFSERGYAATSVAAIGEAAAASRGLVNFHFSSKANLLKAVIEDLVEGLEREMFEPGEEAGPLEALAGLVDSHRVFLTTQPERARLLFRLQAEELNPALGLQDFAGLHERWIARTKPWWDEAVAQDLLEPSLDHNATATFIIGALRGIALEWLLAPDEVDVDRAYGHLLWFVQRGLLRQAGLPEPS